VTFEITTLQYMTVIKKLYMAKKQSMVLDKIYQCY
jgi:hypothetical protein